MSRLGRRRNRFSGLPHAVETVKTVQQPAPLGFTSLKRGVNERGAHERSFGSQKSGLSALLEPLSRKSDRPIFNFQFSIFNFQSPLRFSLLVLALGVLAVRLDAAAPARPTNAPPVKTGLDDLLQLFDGSSLHGRLRSMTTETGLRWQHPEARAPIDFRPTNVAWIRFDESEPAAPHSRPTARFRFANGDEVMGRLHSLDAQQVELETWFGDRLLARRTALESVRFLSGNFSVLYEGPTSLEGWQQGRDQSVWQYRSGAFSANGVGVLGRDFKLTNSVVIEFDLAWAAQFNLNVALYTSVFDRFDYTGSAYMFYLLPGYMSLQRLQGGGSSISIGQAQLPDMLQKTKAHVEIRISKPDATFGVWIDGNLVQRWKDNNGFVAKGSGLTFFSQSDGPSVKISNLIIAEWDGQFETEKEVTGPAAEDLVFFANRDKAAGNLLAVRDGKLSFVTGQTSLEVPLPRVSRLVLRLAEANKLPRSPWEIRAYFAGGGAVSFHLEQWDEAKVAGVSPNFGRLAFNPRSIRQLRFNLDRGESWAEKAAQSSEQLWDVEE